MATGPESNSPNSTSMEKVQLAFVEAGVADHLFLPPTAEYQATQESFFDSQVRDQKPVAIFKPNNAEELAKAIQVLKKLAKDVQFAVKSGGHTVWPGASNIHHGITIDLAALNHVHVHEERNEVSVGAGAKWGDVYSVLQTSKMVVPGGRVADVGVGGLALGGGISYFSPRVGFVCDNIVKYKIILADGSIAVVTQSSHPDLYWALKGGGSNFGIVTEFTLRSFPSGNIFGGALIHPGTAMPDLVRAFYDFASSDDKQDEYGSVICSFSFTPTHGLTTYNFVSYTKPEENPASLAPFLNVREPLMKTTRVTTQFDLTDEQRRMAPPAFRNVYITSTMRLDLDALQAVLEIWQKSAPVGDSKPIDCWTLTFQILNPATTHKSAAHGGNPMGLADAPPLVILLLCNFWKDDADTAVWTPRSLELLDQIESETKKRGVYHPYKYLNYAWKGQDVFSGYGAENKARLQEIARKYDPEGFYQTAMPGGIKLFAPEASS